MTFAIRFDGETVVVRSMLSSLEELALDFADLSSDELSEVSAEDCEVQS